MSVSELQRCEKVDCTRPAEATLEFEDGVQLEVCATHAMQMTTEYPDDVEVVE